MKRKSVMLSVLVLATVTVMPGLSPGFSYAALPGTLSNPYTGGVAAAVIQYDSDKNYPSGSHVPLSQANTTGGTSINWVHDGVSEGVHYQKGIGIFPDGSTAGMLNYTQDAKDSENGHLLVAKKDDAKGIQDSADWVKALGGDLNYVAINSEHKTTALLNKVGKTWDMLPLPLVVNLSGGTINTFNGSPSGYLVSNGDGTATPKFYIHPTKPPLADLTMASNTFNVGQNVVFTLKSTIYAYNTNWHFETVEVTGDNNFKRYLTPVTQSAGNGQAGQGTSFPYWGEAGQAGFAGKVWGGGPQPPYPNTAGKSYTETATLNTAGLAPGSYKVNFTLFDAIGRKASNGTVEKTFTLVANGAPLPNPPAQPDPNSNVNLSLKFDPFQEPIPVGTAVIPVTVSNNSNQQVTTTVNFSRFGFKSVHHPVPATYDEEGEMISSGYYFYDKVPETLTQSQTVTIPANSAKKLTFSVYTGRRIMGYSYSGFYDDASYTFQVNLSVNDAKNPAESSYTDNSISRWIKTTGVSTAPPDVVLVE